MTPQRARGSIKLAGHMADFQNTERLLGLGALAVLMAGCLLVLFPFVTALLLAVILRSDSSACFSGPCLSPWATRF